MQAVEKRLNLLIARDDRRSVNSRLINISKIGPLHEANAPSRLGSFVQSMETRGWRDFPPLVVVEFQVGHDLNYRALTGAHRHAAAARTGIEEVPCFVITADIWQDTGLKYEHLRTKPDEERATALSAVGLADFAREILRQNDQI